MRTTSAMAERQMFPVQTTETVYGPSGSRGAGRTEGVMVSGTRVRLSRSGGPWQAEAGPHSAPGEPG